MRVTMRVERDVLKTLAEDPTVCITLEDALHAPNGGIKVYRYNLVEMFHRRLYKQLCGELPDREYLLPNCKTWGCQNPWHRERSRRASRGRVASKCRNGHEYTTENTLPDGRSRCKTCRDARLKRRRKTERQRGQCNKGHLLTDDNVYRWVDGKTGTPHKRCKKCKLAATRASRETNGAAA